MTEQPTSKFDRPIPIAEFLGIRAAADQSDGTFTAEMPASSQTLNPFGVVHGGATATLIDWAAGWGAKKLTGHSGSTTDVFVRYVAAARGGATLRATTSVDREGSSVIAMTVRVADDTDRLIAVASIGYIISR